MQLTTPNLTTPAASGKDLVLVALRTAPAPKSAARRGSKKEMIARYFDEIESALARGHDYESVSKLLTGAGILITANVLKNYVGALRRDRKSESRAAPTATPARTVGGTIPAPAVAPRPVKPAEPAVPRTPEVRPRVTSLPPETPLEDL